MNKINKNSRRNNFFKKQTITLAFIFLISLGYFKFINYSLNFNKNPFIHNALILNTNKSYYSVEWFKTWDFGKHESSCLITASQDGKHIVASGYLGYCSPGDTEGSAFMVKLNDQGNYFWNKMLGGSQIIPVKALFGSDNKIYILISNIHGMLCDEFEYSLINFDKDGNLLYKIEYYENFNRNAYSMVIDSLENIYVVGHKWGKMFISKYDQLGNLIWNKDDNEVPILFDIDSDSYDNIFVINENSLMKFNPEGILLWKLSLSGSKKIRIDKNDKIYILTNSNLIKFDEDGNMLWHLSTNSSLIELDEENNIYLLESNELIKLDSNANKEFILSDNYIEAFYIDSEKNIYTTGIYNQDFFVKKYGIDTDRDGLTDWSEINIYETDPLINDTDNDSLPDGWEIKYELDPKIPSKDDDPDNDDLTNYEEYLNGTHPKIKDTDGDGYNDGIEVKKGTDPLDPYDHPRKNNFWDEFLVPIIIVIVGSVIVIVVIILVLIKNKLKE